MSQFSNTTDITLDLEIRRETELAILVTDGEKTAWLAKKLIGYDDREIGTGNTTEIILPEWLAEEKGLI